MPVELALTLAILATAGVTAGLWLLADRAAGWAKQRVARRVGFVEVDPPDVS